MCYQTVPLFFFYVFLLFSFFAKSATIVPLTGIPFSLAIHEVRLHSILSL